MPGSVEPEDNDFGGRDRSAGDGAWFREHGGGRRDVFMAG